MADKKKKKKKKRKQHSSSITYDYDNIVQVICGNCGHATMVNPNIIGLKSCYFCNSAIHVPKPPSENEENDQESSGAGDEFNDGLDPPEDDSGKEKEEKEKDSKKIAKEIEKSLDNMTPDDIVF